MSKLDIAMEVFVNVGEIVKTADFISAGLKGYEVLSLCQHGYIERVQKGYYRLPSQNDPKEEYLISRFLPNGIVCVESALFHYGYSDFAPREWSVAVPRPFSRMVKEMQERVPLKAYYVQGDVYRLGATTGIFNSVMLPVYDRERTICDCFKYRTKLDNEIFNKALNAYVTDKNRNLVNLSAYAKEMGVYSRMMNIMEVLLNG